ncbi:MAG: ATP-binding protein [Elusimicrobia bacterium]|nr:ATP-binding protein [Elusimicrobiota bacterium]
MWIKRILENEIAAGASSMLILGPRQTGKSSLLARAFDIPREAWLDPQILEGQSYMVYNLLRDEECIRLARSPATFRQEVMARVKGNAPKGVIVDEIQRVPALINEVQSLIDFGLSAKIKTRFLLTGSSARKLRKNTGNLLPGRILFRHLAPLLYAEWRHHYSLQEILVLGSLPGILTAKEQEQRELLKSYATIYLKEEIQAEGIARGIGPFSRFIETASAVSGRQVNYSSLSRDAGVAYSTIRHYFQVLEDTLVGTLVFPYTGKTAKRLSLHPKFFVFDIGVRNALVGLIPVGVPTTEKGLLFEYFIMLEILRLAEMAGLKQHVFFWRTHAGAEVDCVIDLGGRLYAFEIKSNKIAHSSDCSGLLSFKETYKSQVKSLSLIFQGERPAKIGDVTAMPWPQAIEYLQDLFK